MDAQHFDRLTRHLSRTLDRRRFGAVLAALGLSLGLGVDTRAKPKKNKKKPKKCKNGAVKCGKTCINTDTNAAHCGGCGRRCPSGQACAAGECQAGGCPGDRELCAGACVDTASDEDHCGACGNACGGDLTCLDGQCGCVAGTRCGTACVDLGDDDAHCGECGNACNGDLTCSDGACGCAAGTRCGNQCVNVQTNPNHCGACDDPCGAGQTCSGGECGEPPECTSQAQCGGFSIFNDLVCHNGRCVCADADEGICQRFPDGRGSCHQCCPGGNQACPGDHVCHVQNTPSGVSAFCNCPTGSQTCRTGPSNRCVADPRFDPRKCSLDCVDCTTRDPGAVCCEGFCARGCDPGTQCGGLFGPCGSGCSMCGPGTICCNRGPGTVAQCIPNINGFCYVN